MNEVELQAAYYARTADAYDGTHVHEQDEHNFALYWLSSLIEHFTVKSVLDIGSGTGRVPLFLSRHHPLVRVVGVEPVAELRRKGYEKGLLKEQLITGDATNLPFTANSYDMVCEFGALHHIRDHRRAASEMARVAKMGIFLSDGNNFGQGSYLSRAIKQGLRVSRLWPLANLVKTRGRGYHFSEGDGVHYSYSVFDSSSIVKQKFPRVHQLNTGAAGPNLYRTASHVAVFAYRQ
jgi:SAM-dependent methyltransferase